MANVTVTKAGKVKSVPGRFVPTFLLLGWTEQQSPKAPAQTPLEDLPISQLRAMTEGLAVEGDRRVKANLLQALRGRYNTRVMEPSEHPVETKQPVEEPPPIEETPSDDEPDEQPKEDRPE